MFNLGDSIDKIKANNLNPIVLAFIGDAVYSLFVREKISFSFDSKTGELNKMAVSMVRASAQAELIKKIMPLLTDEEVAIYKRGRNAKKSTKSKSATVVEYNMSTGFEALVGYLYVTGNIKRLNTLLNEGNKDED